VYLIAVDNVIYEWKGGRPFTLVEAMRELYGCRNAHVIRLDGTLVVLHAGNASGVTHVPSGRTIRRRKVRQR
jgi:hypothetical protein